MSIECGPSQTARAEAAESPFVARPVTDESRNHAALSVVDGPIIWTQPGTVGTRLIGLLVAAGSAIVLTVAARLTPAADGLGTHCQLGLPACGFLISTGLPCPTCGMTTAFAYMMHGMPVRAATAQPLGAMLCLAVGIAAGLGAFSAASGRAVRINWYRISPAALAVGTAALVIVAWGIKVGWGLASGALPYRLH